MQSTLAITLVKNPLDPFNSMDRAFIPYQKELTVREHIERYGTGTINEEIVTSLNGRIVQDCVKPQPGDEIVFCLVVAGGGDDGKSVLRVVAMVAVMAAAVYTGGLAAGAYGAFAGSLTSAAVSIAGGYLINAILPPPGIDTNKLHDASFDRSTNYGWSAPSNASSEGLALPSLIGKRRFAPPRIGAYRYQPPDNSQQQYLRVLYALCDDIIEDLTEEDIFINGKKIAEYPQTTYACTIGDDSEDYSIKWFHDGTLTETQHSTNISEQEEIYNQGVHYASFTEEVFQPSTPFLVNQDVEVINIRAYFPSGLRHTVERNSTKSKRDRGTRYVTTTYHGFKLVVRYRLSGETNWNEKEFTVHPENRYHKAFWRTFTLDGLVSGNYELQFTVRDTKNNPIEVRGITGLSSLSTLPTITTQGTDIEKVGIGLILPSGVYYVADSGGFTDHTVKVGIDLRAVGSTAWLVNHTEIITDHTSAQIRRYIAFDNLPADQYEVRVYVSGLLPTDNRYQHMVLLDYIQEGIEQHLVYRGIACLAVEVLATDALHGQYPTVEVIAQCSDYDTGKPSDNPAWAAYYRLLRHGIDESKIDLSQFQAWATFCTDNNLTANLYLDTQLSLQTVLNNVSLAGRANVVNRGGKWGVIIDEASIPKQTFTSDDIIEDSFEESFLPSSELANTIICWFFDESNDYRRTAVEVRDPSITSGEDIRKVEITLYAVTNLSQATKHAKVMLNQTRLVNRTVSWKSDIDAINSQVGDIVLLQHDIPEWGINAGRVVSADSASVTVDLPVDYSDSETSLRDYRLCIRHMTPRTGENEDFLEVKPVNNPYALGSPANESVITYTLKAGETWERIPESGSLISLGWITGSEESTGDELLSLKQFRIVNLERYQEQQFKITAVEYYDDAYQDSYIVSLPVPESGLSKVDMVKVNSAWSMNGKLHTDFISLSWVGNAASYYLFYKTKQDSEWSEWRYYQSTGNTSITISDLPTGQEYLFSVSTQNNPESGSQINLAHETADHVDLIEPVTDIVCVQTGTSEWIGKDLEVSWLPFTLFSLKVYRVEVLDVLNTVLRSELTGTERYLYTYEKNVEDHNGSASSNVRIRVTVIDQTDNEAASIIQVLTNNPPVEISNIRTSKGSITQFTGKDLDIVWNASTEEDFKAYEVTITHGSTDLRTEYVIEPFYRYTLSMNAEDGNGTPSNSIVIKIRVIDSFNQASGITSLTLVNPAPGIPQGLTGEEWMQGLRFTWNHNPETDISHYLYRLKTESESWGPWIMTLSPIASRFLTENESIAYEGSATISIEVKTIDTFGTESGVATLSQTTGSLDIPPTSITDFNQISSAFPKIPVIIGDTWNNNVPVAGSISWNDHELWYNGVKYSIQAGSTPDQYIYWINGASSYSTSNEVLVLNDESFIIATNIDGNHDLAWNALANEVIGSAFIKKAAIHDLHVSEISANKLTANSVLTPGVYIGGARYGEDGSQPSIDELKPAEGGATMGANWTENLSSIPVRFADTPQGDGLYVTDTYMGYYSGGVWQTYIQNNGHYYFKGDQDQYISWDGNKLTVAGEVHIKNPSTVRSNIRVEEWASPTDSNIIIDPSFIKKVFEGVDYWIGNATFYPTHGENSVPAVQITAVGGHHYAKCDHFISVKRNDKLYIKIRVFIESAFDGIAQFIIQTFDKEKNDLYNAPTLTIEGPKGVWFDWAGTLENYPEPVCFIKPYFENVGGTTNSFYISYFYLSKTESGANITETHTSLDTQHVRGYDSTLIACSQGQIFRETFENPDNNFSNNYDLIYGGSNWQIIQSSESVSGGKFIRCGDGSGDDMVWFFFNKSIPYDSSKLHRMKVRLRAHGETTGAVQIGVHGRNYDDTKTLNRWGAEDIGNYSTVGGETIYPPNDGQWHIYEGYFKGLDNTIGGLHSTDPNNPSKLFHTFKYIRPVILVNQVSQPGTVDIDEISIEILPENADQIAESDTKKWAGETGANITETRISADTAKVGGYNSSLVVASQGYVFQETFENPNNDIENRWYIPIANGEWSIVASPHDTDSITGGKYLRLGNNSGNDMVWFIFNHSIPYNPSKLYRLKFRVRNHTPAGSPGRAHFGLTGRNFNDTEYVSKVGANDFGNFHEIAGTYIDPPRLGWVEYTGYFKGTGATGGSYAPDPSTPAPLHQNCKYFRPCFLVHQSDQLGMIDIDEISIDIIPENADQIAESNSRKWAGESGATNDGSWRHPSDSTKINGGHIYTDTISLNSINGASGVLDITAGKIMVSTVNGIEIDGSGGMRVLSGGDIILESTNTDKGKLILKDTTNNKEFEFSFSNNKLSLNTPESDTTTISFGSVGQFNANAESFSIGKYNKCNIEGGYYFNTGGGSSYRIYQNLGTYPSSRSLVYYCDNNLYAHFSPEYHNNAIDLGTNQYAWKNIYYYTPHDKCLYLDDLDDLKILHVMQPSCEIDPQCNLPKLDLNSLPRWMTNYETLKEEVFNECGEMINNEDFDEFIRDEDHLGYRLFRKSGHFMDIVAGAVRQLDKKLNQVIRHIKKTERKT